MSPREVTISCTECKVCVVSATLADGSTIFEIGLDDSVTDAYVLSNGMNVAGFYSEEVIVVHREVDGEIRHSIVRKDTI